MGDDLPRPCRRNRIVPSVNTVPIILSARVALRQVEFNQPRSLAAESPRADGPPEVGEIGFIGSLAWNQNEIGRIDGADRRQRQLLGVATTNADERERRAHRSSSISAPNRMMAVAEPTSWESCSASVAIVMRASF